MKKIFISFICVLFMAGLVFAYTGDEQVKVSVQSSRVSKGSATGPGTGVIMGQPKYDHDPHKTFRLVRYVPIPTDSETLDLVVSKDSIVIWATGSSGDDGVTVTLTTTSLDSRVAGILAANALPPVSTDVVSDAQADVGKRNWTWLQTYGRATAFLGSGDSAAGDAFGTSTITGEVGTFAISGDATLGTGGIAASSSSANFGIAGFFYAAGTAGDDGVKVFLKCE